MYLISTRTAWAAILVALAFGAHAQGDPQAPTNSDWIFITQALESGTTEISLGKIAQKNASSEAVKKFGQRMIKDHSKAGQELKALASKLGYNPPQITELKKKEDTIEMFSRLSGDEFDVAYGKAMVKSHHKAVAMFKEQAKKADSPALRQFADNTLPVLQEHLKLAQSLPGVKPPAEKKKTVPLK